MYGGAGASERTSAGARATPAPRDYGPARGRRGSSRRSGEIGWTPSLALIRWRPHRTFHGRDCPPTGGAVKRSGLKSAALAILIGLAAAIPPSPASRVGARASHHPAPLHRPGAVPASLGIEDDSDAQSEMEFMMLRDPQTNTIPRDIHR